MEYSLSPPLTNSENWSPTGPKVPHLERILYLSAADNGNPGSPGSPGGPGGAVEPAVPPRSQFSQERRKATGIKDMAFLWLLVIATLGFPHTRMQQVRGEDDVQLNLLVNHRLSVRRRLLAVDCSILRPNP